MQRLLASLATLVLAPSIAAAQEPPAADTTDAPTTTTPTPAVPPPTPAVVVAPPPPPAGDPAGDFGPPEGGFQIQARLATQFGATAILSPGFAVGYRRGNLVLGGQLGVMGGSIEADGEEISAQIVQIVPTGYWDFWRSRDGRARMNLVFGLGIGRANLQIGDDEFSASFVPALLGVGGDYYLHRNFAIGVEVGAQVPLLSKVEEDGEDLDISGNLQSIHGLVRFTFIAGD
jgi:hypothetical protein